MHLQRATIAAAALTLAAGCSSGTATGKAPPSCVQALDAADAGFTAFGQAITAAQHGIDQGFAGNYTQAQRTLQSISLPSPTRYKTLEAACRRAH